MLFLKLTKYTQLTCIAILFSLITYLLTIFRVFILNSDSLDSAIHVKEQVFHMANLIFSRLRRILIYLRICN